MIEKVVSGGQTGVDRAALDAAMRCRLPVAGWCPLGRRAEDGAIDTRYPLIETPLADNAQRTCWNVRDSDGTLILLFEEPVGGTSLAIEEAHRLDAPVRLVTLSQPSSTNSLLSWIEDHQIRVLNIAGPRESEAPGIYEAAYRYLTQQFCAYADDE